MKFVLFSLLFVQCIAASIDIKIEKILRSVDPTAHVGIKVISLKSGKTLYSKNENLRFNPASLVKLFTVATAMETLGPNYKFQTKVYGKITESALQDFQLVASGDPSFSRSSLKGLVLQLKEQGVKKITGNLYLDTKVFDTVEKAPGWPWEENLTPCFPTMSALVIDRNCVEMHVQPGESIEMPATLSTNPACAELKVSHSIQTSKRGRAIEIQGVQDGSFELRGAIPLTSSGKQLIVPVRTPLIYAKGCLKWALDKHQIECDGDIIEGAPPHQGEELASYDSPPLSELIKTLNIQSDNLYADCVFKKVGCAQYGIPGSWQNGKQAVVQFLGRTVGIDTKQLVIVDGSGLSRHNLISPSQMTTFLSWIHHKSPFTNAFKDSLETGGMGPFLKGRMKHPALRRNIRAKTGTMMGVSGICGFLKNESDEELVFTIMVNHFVEEGKVIKKKIEDRICEVLATTPID